MNILYQQFMISILHQQFTAVSNQINHDVTF